MVSVIGLGTGGKFASDSGRRANDVKVVKRGIDLGINFIDTAEVYAEGCAEELVGKTIRGKRDQFVIATKFSPEHSTYGAVLQAAEGSLRRLRTDYIDLYQAHWSNPRVPLEDTMRGLDRLVQDGKVRYVGVSNYSVKETLRARDWLRHSTLVSMQQEYNLFERTAEDVFLPVCRNYQLSLIAYSPLARGNSMKEDGKARQLADLAGRVGMSVPQLVLRWIVRDPCIVAIPATTKEQHIRDNAASFDIQIDNETIEKISNVFSSEVSYIPTDQIRVVDDGSSTVYTTLAEARENRFGLVPSPTELAGQIASGEFLKPIKLRFNRMTHDYEVIDGKVRYWAWVLAHHGRTAIPARIE